MNRKPGDWDCNSCNHFNFSWRESCQRCSESKPAGGYGGKGEERHDYGRCVGESFHVYGSSNDSGHGGDSEFMYGRKNGYFRSRNGFEDDYRSGYWAMDRSNFRVDYSSSFASDPRSRFGGVTDPRSGFGGNILGSYGSDAYGGDLRSGYERGFGINFRGRYGNDYCEDYEADYRGGSNNRNGNNGGDYNHKSFGGSDYNGRSYGGGPGFNRSEMRPGDWHCKENGCGAHNFASRISCFKCGVSKDEMGNHGKSGGYGYESRRRSLKGEPGRAGDGGEEQSGWRPGDWMCSRSGCNEHNFATRSQCFRCQAPRDS